MYHFYERKDFEDNDSTLWTDLRETYEMTAGESAVWTEACSVMFPNKYFNRLMFRLDCGRALSSVLLCVWLTVTPSFVTRLCLSCGKTLISFRVLL